MKRRTFLKGLGGVTVLAVAGGVYRAVDQGVFSVGDGAAYEPWHDWDSDSASGPLALVRAGILAANPHNTQPWIFSLSEDRIDLYADPSRHLGAMDAFGREMHTGLGCAIENMVLAGSAEGYAIEPTILPGRTFVTDTDNPVLVARLLLAPEDVNVSDRYHQIPHRHTNRAAYDTNREMDQDVLRRFMVLATDSASVRLDIVSDAATRLRLGQTITDATAAILKDRDMVMASEVWFRHDWDALQVHKDGVTFDAMGSGSLVAAIGKIMPRLDPQTNHDFWLAATRDVHTATAAAYGIISLRDLYDREQNMIAGMIWQRIHLHATKLGIAMQPLNQPLEIVDRMVELGGGAPDDIRLDGFVPDGWSPTFCFRMGYAGASVNASPRRGLDEVVKKI